VITECTEGEISTENGEAQRLVFFLLLYIGARACLEGRGVRGRNQPYIHYEPLDHGSDFPETRYVTGDIYVSSF